MKMVRTIRGVCVFLTILLGASAAFPNASEQFHRAYALAVGAPVTVENVNGSVSIAAWDSSYADVSAEKRTSGNSRELAKVRIEITTTDGLRMKTVAEKGNVFFSWTSPRVTVDYMVRVPRSAAVRTARTVNGDVKLRGVAGDASAYTTNGDIIVDGVARIAEAETTNGSITVTGGAVVSEAATTNGSIRAEVSGGGAPMEFSVVNGSITLSAPAGVGADVDMRTVNGNIVVPDGFTLKQGTISKNHLSGRLGSGGPAITAKTVNGSISLNTR